MLCTRGAGGLRFRSVVCCVLVTPYARDGDAGVDEEAPEDLRGREPGAEPEPFAGGGDGCGETLRHEDGEAGAEQRERAVDAEVAETHADDAA